MSCVSGTPLNVPNAYECPLFDPAIDRRTHFVTRSILCVPVQLDKTEPVIAVLQVCAACRSHDRRVDGARQVINKTSYEVFSSDDEAALEMFATEVAIQLKRLSLDTAFEKVCDAGAVGGGCDAAVFLHTQVLRDGRNNREVELTTSLLSLYTDKTARVRLQTQVLRARADGRARGAAFEYHMSAQVIVRKMSIEQSMLESWGPELGVVLALDPHHPILTWDFNVFDHVRSRMDIVVFLCVGRCSRGRWRDWVRELCASCRAETGRAEPARHDHVPGACDMLSLCRRVNHTRAHGSQQFNVLKRYNIAEAKMRAFISAVRCRGAVMLTTWARQLLRRCGISTRTGTRSTTGTMVFLSCMRCSCSLRPRYCPFARCSGVCYVWCVVGRMRHRL